jgi:hypothetical protein
MLYYEAVFYGPPYFVMNSLEVDDATRPLSDKRSTWNPRYVLQHMYIQ